MSLLTHNIKIITKQNGRLTQHERFVPGGTHLDFCYRKLLSEYYDYIYPECDGKELDYWLEYVKNAEKPILEIGCGTGRVTIPLLTKGYDITAIDTSPFMLDKLYCFRPFHT